MPQNKPMKIQWIYHGGRSIPLVLPQTYSYEIEDWKVTSDRDPLPIVEYGTTAGGIVVPKRVSDDGHELTQLTGSYVEYNAAQRNFSITAGASKTIEFIFDRNVEAFVITLYKPQAHTTSKPTYMFRFGTYGAPAFSVELPLLNENTSRGFTSKKIDVLHNRAIMILSNNDTSDQNYSVFVTLFKKSLDGSVTISEI